MTTKLIPAVLFAAMMAACSAHVCREGDPSVRIIAPFDLYNLPGLHADLVGHFPAGGAACIDNNLNNGMYPPAQDRTWVYFRHGVRDFNGVAPLSAFEPD